MINKASTYGIRFIFNRLEGMKQKDVAEKLGITPSTLSSYRTFRAILPLELIQKAIEAFSCLKKKEVLVACYGMGAVDENLLSRKEVFEVFRKWEEEENPAPVVEAPKAAAKKAPSKSKGKKSGSKKVPVKVEKVEPEEDIVFQTVEEDPNSMDI